MKTKLIGIMLFSFLLFSSSVKGQYQLRDGEERKEIKVALLRKLDTQKTIILSESEDISIKTSIEYLKEDFEYWLLRFPHLKSDKKLFESILKQAETENIINAFDLAIKDNLEKRLEYRTAQLLMDGKCLMQYRKNDKVITEMKMQTYSYYCGDLCGDGGRRFFINDSLIFAVMDWIE